MKKPFFMIAGTNSGCGKTTVTLGILHSLVKKGHDLAAFKVGPDYIDPSYHRAITGKSGCNVDSWMMSKETIRYLISKEMKNADIGVIEGVMGFYDGISGEEYPAGSSAHIAEILQIPVILVVNAKGLAQSIVPLINGFVNHDKKINFLGVILNHVGSEHHYDILRQQIERSCDLICFGYIKKLGYSFPERHLGLVPFNESKENIYRFDDITKHINIDLIAEKSNSNGVEFKALDNPSPSYDLTLAVARDRVFSFYYEDNLDLLREQGVKIQFFSPMEDGNVPENSDGIYFGGGFPEIFAAELCRNKRMIDSVREKFMQKMPIYAECGGLIYLFETLIDHENKNHNMAGLIKGTVKMESKRQALGYYEARMNDTNMPLIRGHQFHYSRVLSMEDDKVTPLYQIKKPVQNKWEPEGYKTNNLMASYLHLHFRDQPEFVKYFLNCCVAKSKMH